MDLKKLLVFLEKEHADFIRNVPEKSDIHDINHIRRVWKISNRLCERLNGDQKLMATIVYLHDLGRHYGLEVHGEKSVELAKPILEKLDFSEEEKEIILHAIKVHDYVTPGSERKNIYDRILFDADKIDALGYIGILRHIQHYYLKKGKTIDEIIRMVDKRWNGIFLEESKEMFKDRYEITKNYFVELKKEIEV